MKFAIAFLLLGIASCLVSTNATKTRKMSEAEATSHARALGFVMVRVSKLKNCKVCSDVERYCMEKAIIEDLCMIIKLLAGDMGCHQRELISKLNCGIHIDYLLAAFERNDIDLLVRQIRTQRALDAFVQAVSSVIAVPLKESNCELGEALLVVNKLVGGVLDTGLKLVSGVVGGTLGALLGTANGLVEGVAGTLTHAVGGALGGATGALGGALGGATGALGGATGALGNVAGGLVKSATDVIGGATNLAGGLVNTASGLVGGVANTAGGIVGGVANAAGGLLGGLFGGKKGGLLG